MRLRPAGDHGSILPLVPVVILALFILGGLVVDGSRDLDARGIAQGYAEEAARAGATAIDESSADLKLDFTLAEQRVQSYCDSAINQYHQVKVVSCGLQGGGPDQWFTAATTCNGAVERIVVHTEVKLEIGTTLLGIVGVRTLDAAGSAKARPYEGITAADAC